MPNDKQRDVWSAEDVVESWVWSEPISDYGTAPIMAFLRLSAGERVLDIACGGGKTTVVAAQAVGPSGHVTGVDISDGMVALAKTRIAEAGLHNVELTQGDAQVDDFPSAPFDAVLSQFGIMFFDDPIAALTNIRRQLKPGARAAFITWQPIQRMKWHPVHIIAKYLAPPNEVGTDTKEQKGSWSDAAFAKRVLSSVGFSDIQVEEYNVNAYVPAETDIPASTLVCAVEAKHRDAVLREWHKTRARLTNRSVMQLDLMMNLITAHVPQ
ncbi:MAG: class I SAM-dependent methyltransferase [Chloroflexi bacterium]|nr:class I SAM-dependent methyltransferase [Chloroflexota bacterium]